MSDLLRRLINENVDDNIVKFGVDLMSLNINDEDNHFIPAGEFELSFFKQSSLNLGKPAIGISGTNEPGTYAAVHSYFEDKNKKIIKSDMGDIWDYGQGNLLFRDPEGLLYAVLQSPDEVIKFIREKYDKYIRTL